MLEQNFVTTLLRVILLTGCITSPVWATTPSMPQIRSVADPALASFVHLAVDSHPRLNAARAGLHASRAFEGAAVQPLYNPVLEFDGENTEINTFILGINQTFDRSDKRTARNTLAAAERLASEVQYQQARRTLSTVVLRALAAYQTSLC